MATTEPQLIREKAKRMTNGELANEIKRCYAGIQAASRACDVGRYERRIQILNAECDRRMAAAGGGR